MKNKVSFIPGTKAAEFIGIGPKPSKNYFPKWFKDMPNSQMDLDNMVMQYTAKKCIPFIDSFSTGYTQELICDLEIKYLGKDNDGNDLIQYKYAGDIKPISSRLEDGRSRNVLPKMNGYYNMELHWLTQWEPKTPVGYSTLYTHPANRFDLPFITLNGIIDTDKWNLTGPVGFLIKEGFEGVIPAGTPIYQMFFIKRDSWISSYEKYNEKEAVNKYYSIKRFLHDGYKKLYWSRKDYS